MERVQACLSANCSTAAPNSSITTSNSPSNTTSHGITSSSAPSRQQNLPQVSVYGGIADRQTVQVIQQALHRQPSTAAQYLQQMYAAQQQHLMLQTAALQQQHLNLAAVQQASTVGLRQNCNQSGNASQQALSSQTTIKLANSPVGASQLINRAQGVNSSPVSISQQAVLLGNSSTPTLTASQAQMYLRAQMAQQNNLVQVARSLGRAVPLSPQLILTPTATVTTIQPEASSQCFNQQTTNTQMQNLVLRGQQGAVASSFPQAQHQFGTKQSNGGAVQLALPSLAGLQLKSPCSHDPHGANTSTAAVSLQPLKTNDGACDMGSCVISVSHNMSTVTNHPLINTAYTQIQTHQLLQQHKHQFLIQQQSQLSQGNQAHLLQPSIQPQAVQTVSIQPAVVGQQCAIPVLPKSSTQQATIFHSTVSSQVLNGQTLLSPTKSKQVQLTAVNLQFQPPPTQTVQVDKNNHAPPAASVNCHAQREQQLLSQPTQEPAPTEQCLSDHSQLTQNTEGPDTSVTLTTASSVCVNGNQAMTSGSGNSAPPVTGSTPHNSHSKTPQAIVKPQILTHVIEGFVIQEGAEPFPVERPSLLIENIKKQKLHSDPEKKAKDSQITDSEMEDLSQQELKNRETEPTLSCELCGKVDFAYNFKRSKRFCSTVCAKRYNVGCTKRMGLFPRRSTLENPKKQRPTITNHHNTHPEARKQQNLDSQAGTLGIVSSQNLSHLSHGESSQCSDMSSYEEPPSPVSVASSGTQHLCKERGVEHADKSSRELPLLTQHFLPSDPTKWNVEDVYEFICALPGFQEIAEEFRSQEIDGQALLLLKEDHLMSTMNIKLGPALKVFARISMLKDS